MARWLSPRAPPSALWIGARPRFVTPALDAQRYHPSDQPPPNLKINPDGPARIKSLTIKRPKDRYTYMTKPRDELRQGLTSEEVRG